MRCWLLLVQTLGASALSQWMPTSPRPSASTPLYGVDAANKGAVFSEATDPIVDSTSEIGVLIQVAGDAFSVTSGGEACDIPLQTAQNNFSAAFLCSTGVSQCSLT